MKVFVGRPRSGLSRCLTKVKPHHRFHSQQGSIAPPLPRDTWVSSDIPTSLGLTSCVHRCPGPAPLVRLSLVQVYGKLGPQSLGGGSLEVWVGLGVRWKMGQGRVVSFFWSRTAPSCGSVLPPPPQEL